MSFAGTYEMVSSDNFDAYLKQVGVGMVTRKVASSSSPTIILTDKGADSYHMKTVTTFKTIELDFTLGQEFEEETADGRKCKTTITKDGNKLVQTQNLDKIQTKITRTFKDNELVAVFTAGDVTSTRTYKKTA